MQSMIRGIGDFLTLFTGYCILQVLGGLIDTVGYSPIYTNIQYSKLKVVFQENTSAACKYFVIPKYPVEHVLPL